MSRVFSEPLSDTAVRLTCTIRRPPEKVYDAWIQPEQFTKWFISEPSAVCNISEFDARVGGMYRFRMESGKSCRVHGTYQILDRPNQIVFTWCPEESSFETGETLVTINFTAHDDGTRSVLTHEKMRDVASRDNHKLGWTGCLSSLLAYLENLE